MIVGVYVGYLGYQLISGNIGFNGKNSILFVIIGVIFLAVAVVLLYTAGRSFKSEAEHRAHEEMADDEEGFVEAEEFKFDTNENDEKKDNDNLTKDK
jgi:flagellar basal body-associated protein FliL